MTSEFPVFNYIVWFPGPLNPTLLFTQACTWKYWHGLGMADFIQDEVKGRLTAARLHVSTYSLGVIGVSYRHWLFFQAHYEHNFVLKRGHRVTNELAAYGYIQRSRSEVLFFLSRQSRLLRAGAEIATIIAGKRLWSLWHWVLLICGLLELSGHW